MRAEIKVGLVMIAGILLVFFGTLATAAPAFLGAASRPSDSRATPW